MHWPRGINRSDPMVYGDVPQAVRRRAWPCVVHGLLPYGAQILIAMGVAKGLDIQVDSLSLAKSLYYQPLLALAVLLSMLKFRGRG